MQEFINRTLGRYEVVREIGRGSMGSVYLGHDAFTGWDVAIKIAHPDALRDVKSGHRYRKLFFNEARAAGMLRHPNIVSIYDASAEGDIWYLVMEYIAGGRSLHVHCTPESLLPIEEAVRIAFQCAQALGYAHRKGVIHRDVKPRNVLLTRDNDVKISDFSIALITRPDYTDTQVHGYVGSPLYMAPEQIREDGVSTQSDVFGLGLLLYELLSGRHPFAAEKLVSISYNILHKPHVPVGELRAEVPVALERLIDRALAKHPVERYRSCEEVAAALAGVFKAAEPQTAALTAQEKFQRVRGLSFFREFTDTELEEVINTSSWLEYGPDEPIVSEGELDSSFFVIVSGEVGVRKGQQNLQRLGGGDCFGEMGFVAGGPRSATIVARTPVVVLKVLATRIERTSLPCQLRFHKAFLHTLVGRLARTNEWLSTPTPALPDPDPAAVKTAQEPSCRGP